MAGAWSAGAKVTQRCVMGGNYTGGTRPTGGRIAKKAGGRAKGKTNIIISINPGGGQQRLAYQENGIVVPCCIICMRIMLRQCFSSQTVWKCLIWAHSGT